MVTPVKNKELRTVAVEKDTWILEMPDELCVKEGYPVGTLASLTFKDGSVIASFIEPNEEDRRAAERFAKKYSTFMKEMERVGD